MSTQNDPGKAVIDTLVTAILVLSTVKAFDSSKDFSASSFDRILPWIMVGATSISGYRSFAEWRSYLNAPPVE